MAALTDVEAPAPVTRQRVLVVFSGLLLVMLLAALDATVVTTALATLPSIQCAKSLRTWARTPRTVDLTSM